jgi:C4-dicarboxylate transporter DctQ subunit
VRSIIRLYDSLIMMLALLACIMIAAVFVLIVADVTMRTVGMRPPVFSSAMSEYTLIYMTMLAAPWLVRERGHVRIDSFMTFLPIAGQRLLERILIVVCIALCLFAAYLSTKFAIEFWQKNAVDIRSIEIPRALLFVPLSLGFSLCATEFLRLLLIGETLRAPDHGIGAAPDHGH